jgi:hypothetical protein
LQTVTTSPDFVDTEPGARVSCGESAVEGLVAGVAEFNRHSSAAVADPHSGRRA